MHLPLQFRRLILLFDILRGVRADVTARLRTARRSSRALSWQRVASKQCSTAGAGVLELTGMSSCAGARSDGSGESLVSQWKTTILIHNKQRFLGNCDITKGVDDSLVARGSGGNGARLPR
jgi:hypothetical protein